MDDALRRDLERMCATHRAMTRAFIEARGIAGSAQLWRNELFAREALEIVSCSACAMQDLRVEWQLRETADKAGWSDWRVSTARQLATALGDVLEDPWIRGCFQIWFLQQTGLFYREQSSEIQQAVKFAIACGIAQGLENEVVRTILALSVGMTLDQFDAYPDRHRLTVRKFLDAQFAIILRSL